MGDAIVRDAGSAIVMQAQGLDLALRAAAQLKNARGMLPESLKSEGEIVAVLLAGQELGLPAMVSLRGLQVVRGKIIISYDTMIALLRRAGYRIAWPVATSTCATLRLTAPSGETHTETWDEARARKAGLWGSSTWAKFPDTMLRARCVSSAARSFAGEVLSGVYVEDEIEGAPEPGSSGSAEVRDLGAALHEHPEPEGVHSADEPLLRQLSTAMERLAQCVTAGDVHSWIATWASTVSKEPDSTRKSDRWKEIQRKAARATPPVRTEELKRAFGDALAKGHKAAAPDVVEGETVSPLATALDRLLSCETREGLLAWAQDERDVLAGIPRDSETERSVWQCITARAEAIDASDVVNELDALVTARLSGNGSSAATGAGR